MIEMLAVLAIIGILSVAAVAGLMWAFAKYKANNTIHDVHLWELAALDSQQLYSMTSGELVLNELGEVSTHGYPMAIMVQDENVFYISVDDVPKRVCSLTLDMVEEPMIVTVNGTSYTGSDICNADTNQMLFYFNKYMGDVDNTCIPACSGCQSCRNGTCHDNNALCGTNEICSSGTCACAPGAIECQGSCYVCPEGYSLDTLTCSCTCDPQECPENATWNSLTCSCECIEGYDMCNNTCHPQCNGSGMTGERDPDTCACICLEGTNADTCACPEGYIYVDGQCQSFECRDGTTGQTFFCYINGKRCGEYCTYDGKSCVHGICYPDQCPSNTTFRQMPSPYQWHGCHSKTGPEFCTRIFQTTNSNYWTCFDENNDRCCEGTGFGACSIIGSCYDTLCEDLGGTPAMGTLEYAKGCFLKNGLECFYQKSASVWACYMNGTLCGTCQNPLTCCPNAEKCPLRDLNGNPTTYNPEDRSCTNGEISCIGKNCYREGSSCGRLCNETTFGVCTIGDCYTKSCSNGFIYAYVMPQDGWGCVKGSLACIAQRTHPGYSDEQQYACYYNDQLCGTLCTSSGNCLSPLLPECNNGKCILGRSIPMDSQGKPTCDTSVCKSAIEQGWCCPEGHTYANGGCTLIDCPDGQVADEGGICKTACKNNAEVLDCICSGTTHTNQFNAKICCDADHSWDETAETCV